MPTPARNLVVLASLLGGAGCHSVHAFVDGGVDPAGDADGDGIANVHEHPEVDTDLDGTPDYLDLDSDDDGIPDEEEAALDERGRPRDADGDGYPDFVDRDADGNGILDADEPAGDLDGDGVADRADLDDDDDGVSDVDELAALAGEDVDGDGWPNHRDPDSDGDTILDGDEAGADTDRDGLPDVYDSDSDADGFGDAEEAGDADLRTPPVDTDADLLPDFRDVDSDGDGLTDAEERELGTRRDLEDTDGDGVNDAVEVFACPSFDPTCADDATDPTRGPFARGTPVVTVAYGEPPDPPRVTLAFSIERAAGSAGVVYADGARDEVDTESAFVDRVEAHPTADAGLGCEAWPAEDTDGDGRLDTFTSVPAGATVCFDVVFRMNDAVPGERDGVRLFMGYTRLRSALGDDLGYRSIGFLVPADTDGLPPG